MPSQPSKDLETFDNPNPERDYTIRIRIPEFTCLCPKTGQPDFATLLLEYIPDRRCVELKSLKLYIWSFRNEGAFHEAVTNTILGDLVRATDPRWMRLTAEFNVRGGLYTTVAAEHRKAGWAPAEARPQSAAAPAAAVAGPAERTPAAGPTAVLADVPAPAAETAMAQTESRRFRMLPRPRKPGAAPAAAAEKPAAAIPAVPATRTVALASPVHIGIDLGSSHCNAVAIDAAGTVLAQASAPIPLPVRHGPAAEQDAGVWWDALIPVLSNLLQSVPGARVRRIAIDGTSGTVVLCRPDGTPLGPALMYNDARAVEPAKRIAALAPADSGAHGPSSALAKLLWLTSRDQARRDVRVLQQADWISGRLTGAWGHSDYNNCLKLGYDPAARTWPEWLGRLGVEPAGLPVVHAPGDPVGTVRADIARELGLPETAEVVAGTTDGVASFLAAGVSRPGQAVTSLGSTLVIKLLSDKPVYSAPHGVYSHRLGNYWLAGGASNSGGAVLLQYFKLEQIRELSALIDPDTLTGLEYYPLPVVGERFPVNDPHLNPVLEPLPGDSITFFQGLLEGIGRIERLGYDTLRKLGAPAVTEVHTTGGGARNRAWLELRARLLGVPVRIARSDQAAYGTALLAAGLVDPAFGLGPAPAPIRAERA